LWKSRPAAPMIRTRRGMAEVLSGEGGVMRGQMREAPALRRRL
jgi:hypothetical protein